MSDVTRFSLVKPTDQTPFHIDFAWWKEHDGNWRVFLENCLCQEHQALFSATKEVNLIDWIDDNTAEVHIVDGLQHILINHCALQQGFITDHTSLVDAIFRVLLSNGNSPLTATELGLRINRPASIILKTFSGPTVYRGIRPCKI
jgi:hypothetical protein